MTGSGPPLKKPKTDVPEYGSKEYWEKRYANETEERPEHSWYFTYDELRPILLSVLLGRQTEESSDQDSDEEEIESNSSFGDNQQPDPTGELLGEQANKDDANEIASDEDKPTFTTEQITATSTNTEKYEKTSARDATVVKEEIGNESDDGSLSTYVEVQEIVRVNPPPQSPGLASNGPIKVLEIGCGDVPLGEHLARDVPVKEVLCTDYSETVIQKLLQLNIPLLTFRTMDARNMDLQDGSYQLILDKGTLDAMLSDTERGIENCVSIVSECARVLAAPGCMMIVSHLNAHTANGIRWLNEVVFPGLRSIDCKTAKFHLEVHGNDAANESSTENGTDNAAGPAVYIIHKHVADSTVAVKNDDNGKVEDPLDGETVTIIPVQFFTYS